MRKLTSNEIEVKVKQVFEKGAVLLLYKTARFDMAILDETFGSMNWQCDYKVVKDNLYCGIGIKDDKGEWVWKWDCGIESREDDGNEKKGEASDAFKRAGFKWGIGVELYTSPFIFAQVETEQVNGKWVLKNKFQKFNVQGIWYDDLDEIAGLVIADEKGNIVYQWKKKGFQIKQEKEKPSDKEIVLERYKKAIKYLGEISPRNFKELHKRIKEQVNDICKDLEELGLTTEMDNLLKVFAEEEKMV